MIFLTSVTIWASAITGIMLVGFTIGYLTGRRPFICDHTKILSVYLGCLLALVCIAAGSQISQVSWLVTSSQALVVVCGLAYALMCPILAISFIRDGLAARRLRLADLTPCRACQYDLTGNISGICPECGTPLTEEQSQHIRRVSILRLYALKVR